jgi:uncharacterized protein YbbC (DUF1343 family)
MILNCIHLYLAAIITLATSCKNKVSDKNEKSIAEVSGIQNSIELSVNKPDSIIYPGAFQLTSYLDSLKGKNIAIVANATSTIGNAHLVDSLINCKVKIKIIFSPEHGFRGDADAGEELKNYTDGKTGIQVFSLYGDNKKPTAESLKNIDVIVFDIQDVGVRFYTYISTLHYVMEAAAENKIKVIVLDRPNPNGFYFDGPVLQKSEKSFVGMHPVPIVYGMTIGEYAQMINGEGWLKNGIKCNLNIIKCENYNHNSIYNLPVKPSPNLKDNKSIYLYPSLCLFEGTIVSVGRGTENPFKVIGYPDYPDKSFYFVPESKIGASNPMYNNKKCYGIDFTSVSESQLIENRAFNLKWVLLMYEKCKDKESFFLKGNFFNKLVGNDLLIKQIKNGLSEQEIRASWKSDLELFKQTRKKYLLYTDFKN